MEVALPVGENMKKMEEDESFRLGDRKFRLYKSLSSVLLHSSRFCENHIAF